MNKAAQSLGRRGGKAKTEAKAAASAANGKLGGRPAREVIAMLYRNADGWWLARWKGDVVPSRNFPNAKEAKDYAAANGWGVKRMPDCDA